MDHGYIVCFTSTSVIIYNCPLTHSLSLSRDPQTQLWKMPISLLQQLPVIFQNNNNESTLLSYSARLSIDNHHRSIRKKVLDLHERMSHAPEDLMCAALSGSHSTWSNTDITPSDVRRVFRKEPCLACVLGKRNVESPHDHSHDSEPRRQWLPGECISCDPVISISPVALDGEIGFFSFTDVSTGYLHCVPTKSKSSTAYIEAVQQVHNFYLRYGLIIRVIRTDAEFTLHSAMSDQFLASLGIRKEHSTPYAHYQNIAERYIQTIIKGTSTLLHGQPWLRADMWSYALYTYCNTRNHTPNSITGTISPNEIITKQRTNLSRMFKFAFGDFVVHSIPKELRDWKFDLRNDLSIYVGQPEGSIDSHFVYDPYKHKVYERTGVQRIDVSDYQFLQWYSMKANKLEQHLPYHVIKDAAFSLLPSNDQSSDMQTQLSPVIVMDEEKTQQPFSDHRQLFNQKTKNYFESIGQSASQSLPSVSFDIPYVDPQAPRQRPRQQQHRSRSVSPSIQPVPSHMYLRSSDKAIAAAVAWLSLYDQAYTHLYSYSDPEVLQLAYAAKSKRSDDTPTVSKALKSPQREEWIKAIRKEKDQLIDGGTLQPVSTLADEYSYADTLAQLRIKRNATDGSIEKLKARICARGDQLEGVLDPEATYSPTINILTFCTIFHLSIIRGMHRRTIDTVGAYLYQKYPTEQERLPLYVKLQKQVAEVCGLDPQVYYQVKRYIYGLPDAGRAYYLAVSTCLIDHGYTMSKSDPCLFYRITSDGSSTYATLHVDDTFVCSTTLDGLDHLANSLRSSYEITMNDLGDTYLGIHLETLANGAVKLSQPKLLQSLFEEYKPENRKLPRHQRRHPTPTRSQLSSKQSSSSNEFCSVKEYLHLLGQLLYLIRSRPDLLTALSFAATKSQSPTKDDYNDLLYVVDYLYLTRDEGLILKPLPAGSNLNDPLALYCAVDASYLIHPDSKSHTGYTLSFGTLSAVNLGYFYSKSMKQSLVATSSTHAEMRALYSLIQDIIFVVELCKEIGQHLHLPAIVFEDNQPVITMATTTSTGIRKCKHFLMLIAFVKEQVEVGLIDIRKVASADNVGDFLSKLTYGSNYTTKKDLLLGKENIV